MSVGIPNLNISTQRALIHTGPKTATCPGFITPYRTSPESAPAGALMPVTVQHGKNVSA